MSRILEELQKILSESEISLEDQNDLLILLPILPKESLQKLVKVFQKDFEALKEFNKNFKSKLKVLIGKDTDEWNDIVKQEEEKLQEAEEEDALEAPEDLNNQEEL